MVHSLIRKLWLCLQSSESWSRCCRSVGSRRLAATLSTNRGCWLASAPEASPQPRLPLQRSSRATLWTVSFRASKIFHHLMSLSPLRVWVEEVQRCPWVRVMEDLWEICSHPLIPCPPWEEVSFNCHRLRIPVVCGKQLVG